MEGTVTLNAHAQKSQMEMLRPSIEYLDKECIKEVAATEFVTKASKTSSTKTTSPAKSVIAKERKEERGGGGGGGGGEKNVFADDDDEEDEEEEEEEEDEPTLCISTDEEEELEAQRIHHVNELLLAKKLAEAAANASNAISDSGTRSNDTITTTTTTKLNGNEINNESLSEIPLKIDNKTQLPAESCEQQEENKNVIQTINNDNITTATTTTTKIVKKIIVNNDINLTTTTTTSPESNAFTSPEMAAEEENSSQIALGKIAEKMKRGATAATTTTINTNTYRETCGIIYAVRDQRKFIFHCSLCQLRYAFVPQLLAHMQAAHAQLFTQSEATQTAAANVPTPTRRSTRKRMPNQLWRDDDVDEQATTTASTTTASTTPTNLAATTTTTTASNTMPVVLPAFSPIESVGSIMLRNRKTLYLLCCHCNFKSISSDAYQKHMRRVHEFFATLKLNSSTSSTTTTSGMPDVTATTTNLGKRKLSEPDMKTLTTTTTTPATTITTNIHVDTNLDTKILSEVKQEIVDEQSEQQQQQQDIVQQFVEQVMGEVKTENVSLEEIAVPAAVRTVNIQKKNLLHC